MRISFPNDYLFLKNKQVELFNVRFEAWDNGICLNV